MKSYAKNYLPILFNIYTSEGNASAYGSCVENNRNAVHLSILETVSLYIPLTPDDLIHRYIISAIEKVENNDATMTNKVFKDELFISFIFSVF